MRRRKFLGLFGGAIAAPMMPLPAMAATKATYSKAALHGAIMHAQARGSFSVWGLAQAVKIPVAQAEALMGDLAKRGILGPLQGTTFGGRWATSNVLLRDTLTATKAVQKTNNVARRRSATLNQAEPDLGPFIAHLRQVCVDYGMTLHARCAVS